MILNKEVEINITNSNIGYYKNCGYTAKSGDCILINVNHLPNKSSVLVNVKCDICGFEKIIIYHSYIHNTKNLTVDYCCCQKCAIEKHKKSCLNNFGSESPLQNELFKEKSKQTCLKNHGVETPLESKKIREKGKITMEEKYGTEYALQNKEIREKFKNTCLEVYGFENPMKNESVNNKKKNTCFNNNGAEFPMQNREIFEKGQKNGVKSKIHEQTNLRYQGTHEKRFLDCCFENDIKVEKFKSIKYEFDGKTKVYYPDFYLKNKNLIIEVKSAYYYKKYLDKNLAKQQACIDQGYNFIFVIDKNYDEFLN